jgi:hypothetical protein
VETIGVNPFDPFPPLGTEIPTDVDRAPPVPVPAPPGPSPEGTEVEIFVYAKSSKTAYTTTYSEYAYFFVSLDQHGLVFNQLHISSAIIREGK